MLGEQEDPKKFDAGDLSRQISEDRDRCNLLQSIGEVLAKKKNLAASRTMDGREKESESLDLNWTNANVTLAERRQTSDLFKEWPQGVWENACTNERRSGGGSRGEGCGKIGLLSLGRM